MNSFKFNALYWIKTMKMRVVMKTKTGITLCILPIFQKLAHPTRTKKKRYYNNNNQKFHYDDAFKLFIRNMYLLYIKII